HEEILLWRINGECERIPTRGTWLGAVREIDKVTENQTVQLQPGDLMILYTDGLIECRNQRGKPFGFERMAALVEKHRNEPADVIRLKILRRLQLWMDKQDDDVTLIVVRCQGVYWR